MTVLITGATGFVGRALVDRLRRDAPTATSAAIRAVTRRADHRLPPGVEAVQVNDIASISDWGPMLRGVRAVVHLAARVHVMHDRHDAADAQYRSVNTEATERLARAAVESGVTRFVFVSSIKVLGERTRHGEAFSDASPTAAAHDGYARSKLAAERALIEIATETGLEVVIVRPPLVYGPDVGANFRALMAWIARGWPLPLASIDNRRSLIGVENLADFLACCLEHPAAANEAFVISDGEDLSTPELVQRVAAAQGREARLVAVSPALLHAAATAVGKGAALRRLLESLQVDGSRARTRLGWSPPTGVDEQLRRTVRIADAQMASGAIVAT